MNRIADDNRGVSRHFDAITYLNNLSLQWKLRKAGEGHELTLALIGEWRRWRQEIAECRHTVDSWSYLGNRPFKMPIKTASHALVLQTVGQIILNLEAEYGWPAPLQPLVTEADIARLRDCIRELEECREQVKFYR
jgi:hypothetical protein